MIQDAIIKKLARDWKLKAEDVEKYYVLGWILFGIQKSSVGKSLAFKGGTAISKVYFPSDWRLSEDLDFTLLDKIDWNTIISALYSEVPSLVQGESGITLRRKPKDEPLTNAGYLQYKMRYSGPLYQGMIKIEVTKEKFKGNITNGPVPNDPNEFDYPKFSVNVYSLETIVGEKIRAILERGYIRDYYDVWRLLKEKKFDQKEARKMFEKKREAKDVKFSNIDEFFPKGTADILKEHLPNLTRLIREPLPSIEDMLDELRESLKVFLK
ncbi:MAG: nucleotidyl transferase AbiEii/AbiGii toxin family protein [Nitrosotalea sp.]